MTNEHNWWQPYIGKEIYHKSHVEFKGIVAEYDTDCNKFKVNITEWIDLADAHIFCYMEVDEIKQYCDELSETQG